MVLPTASKSHRRKTKIHIFRHLKSKFRLLPNHAHQSQPSWRTSNSPKSELGPYHHRLQFHMPTSFQFYSYKQRSPWPHILGQEKLRIQRLSSLPSPNYNFIRKTKSKYNPSDPIAINSLHWKRPWRGSHLERGFHWSRTWWSRFQPCSGFESH